MSQKRVTKLTTIVIYPNEWKQFQAVAAQADLSASAMVRGFVRDTLRRAAKTTPVTTGLHQR